MPIANTFSICAVEPQTGEAGVAVASYCLAVGALVPYAEPGVGAVATQSEVNPIYGVRGLELLRAGLAPAEILERLRTEDIVQSGDDAEAIAHHAQSNLRQEGEDFYRDRAAGRITWFTGRTRQVGMVDRTGRAAAFTGERVNGWAGHRMGQGYCCQGNLLAGERVISDMAAAYERARAAGRPLLHGLWLALAAGEAAGGDRRGKLAAGLLVTREHAHWTGSHRYCDLRVDSHPDAVAELERILAGHGFIDRK